jgi:hypothetical protein
MRKHLLVLCFVFGMTGLVTAAEVTLLKHDAEKKQVTVREGEKEVVYKYTDKTKVTLIDRQDGSVKEGTLDVATKLFSKETAINKLKFEITADKDTLTEIKLKGKKKN